MPFTATRASEMPASASPAASNKKPTVESDDKTVAYVDKAVADSAKTHADIDKAVAGLAKVVADIDKTAAGNDKTAADMIKTNADIHKAVADIDKVVGDNDKTEEPNKVTAPSKDGGEDSPDLYVKVLPPFDKSVLSTVSASFSEHQMDGRFELQVSYGNSWKDGVRCLGVIVQRVRTVPQGVKDGGKEDAQTEENAWMTVEVAVANELEQA